MSKSRAKVVIAALLANIFVIAYSIERIGINKLLILILPMLLLSFVLFTILKRNGHRLPKIPKNASMLGIAVGLIAARLLHSYSSFLEVSFIVFTGIVFLILAFVASEEELIEK